ncbi:MAG: T9SS type A sorting domain-containing protein [candidate division WOR-3 bacterium]
MKARPDTSPTWWIYAIVSKSTDQGITWERDTLKTAFGTSTTCICNALAIDRSNSNIVYAGGDSAGIYPFLYKTTNGGLSWISSSSGLSGAVRDIKVSSNNPNIVFVGTSSGIYKSTNGGTNWMPSSLSANIQAVLINPTDDNEVYAATTSGIYKSTNGGNSWTEMNTGIVYTNATSLGIYPNNYLFCGTKGTGVYRHIIQVGGKELKYDNMQKISLWVIPNPFRNYLTIKFEVKGVKSETTVIPLNFNLAAVRVYDVSGRTVKSFDLKSILQNQTSSITWDGSNDSGCKLPVGVYFVRLEAGDYEETEKVILIK